MTRITTFLTVPDSSGGRAAFVAQANQFGHDMTPLANQINAVADEINDHADTVESGVIAAGQSRDQAQTYMLAAQAAAIANAPTWTAMGTYAANDLVWGDAVGSQLYRCITSHTGSSTPPAVDETNWVLTFASAIDVTQLQADVDGLRDVGPVAKTAPYTLALADRGLSIDTTAGVTVPANAAVNFPDGAVVMVTNVSEASISITPAAGVTLRLAGFGNAGTRTLDKWGVCSLRKIVGNLWLASGAGLR